MSKSKAAPSKTVDASEVTSLRMAAGNEKKYSKVILNGHLREWVGIGWIDTGPATTSQLRRYPHVVGQIFEFKPGRGK